MHPPDALTLVVVATRNAHKLQEIRAILGGSFGCRALDDFPGAPAVVEDAPTFAGNAVKKATQLADWLASSGAVSPAGNTLVLADDSGLEVDVLGGAPGVLSARFAALDEGGTGNSTDSQNNAKLLRLLQGVPLQNRTARFRCVLALVQINPPDRIVAPQIFDGVCEGRIIASPSGENGFGYDPLFVPVGFEKTFAELGDDTKNRLSHRAQALAKLRGFVNP